MRYCTTKPELPTLALALYSLLFWPSTLSAADTTPALPPGTATSAAVTPPPIPDQAPSTLLSQADGAHLTLSSSLEAAARRIDGFFATDQSFAEATDTYARLRMDTIIEDEGDIGFKADVKIKLDLPRTERRFKLLIESDPQGAPGTEPQERPIQSIQEQDYFLSIESTLREGARWDVRPAIGIKLHTPVDPFARLRAIRYFDLGDWLLRSSPEVFWFNSEGLGALIDIDLDRALTPKVLFRSSTTPSWLKEEDFGRVDQRFTLYRHIDDRHTLSYQIGLHAKDDPAWRVEDYFAATSYRIRVHKKWLFLEFIPSLSFPASEDYDMEPRVTLRLEGVFGKGYL